MYWLLWKSYFIALIQYTYARRRVDTFSFNSTSSILARQLNEHLRHSTTTNEKYYRTLTVESHRVRNLPGLDPLIASRLVHYAGYLPVDDSGQGNLFYWLFEADKNPEQAPLVVWLNGGPGCTSMDGLFLELGPLRLDGPRRDRIKINPDSWHNEANILFIDQPVGTGLAYTSNNAYARNDETISENFYYFLKGFFELHTKYIIATDSEGKYQTRPFFFTGESHAGHYIPCLSKHIISKNKDSSRRFTIDLQGIMLGNPWLDPHSQYDVSEFAHAHGIVTAEQKYKLQELNQQCQKSLSTGQLSQPLCFRLLDDVIDASSLGKAHKALMYDIRKYVLGTHVFPPGHEDVERYLNRDDVRKAIHSLEPSRLRFVECADPPYNALAHQDGKSALPELEALLNAGVRVLVFSGQYDMICHHLGSEKALQKANWDHKDGYLSAPGGVYLVSGQVAGYIRSYKNLANLVGHYFAYACDSSEQWAYGSHGSACSQFGHIHPFHCWERPELRGDQTGVDAHFTCVPLVSTVRS